MNASNERQSVQLNVVEQSATCLADYASVSIAFEVSERLDVDGLAPGTEIARARVHAVHPSYVKDYDAVPGCAPTGWAARWDVSEWWFGGAYIDGRRVGGVVVVPDARDIERRSARPDAALLWDVRVHPQHRRSGVGRQLIDLAERYARSRGRRRVRVETQDVNVAACRFYARAGYALAGVERGAYPAFPGEVRLVFEKAL